MSKSVDFSVGLCYNLNRVLGLYTHKAVLSRKVLIIGWCVMKTARVWTAAAFFVCAVILANLHMRYTDCSENRGKGIAIVPLTSSAGRNVPSAEHAVTETVTTSAVETATSAQKTKATTVRTTGKPKVTTTRTTKAPKETTVKETTTKETKTTKERTTKPPKETTAAQITSDNRESETVRTAPATAAAITETTAVTETTDCGTTAICVEYPLDINRATKEELMTLPNFTEEVVDRIMEWRENGFIFENSHELVAMGLSLLQVAEVFDLVFVAPEHQYVPPNQRTTKPSG